MTGNRPEGSGRAGSNREVMVIRVERQRMTPAGDALAYACEQGPDHVIGGRDSGVLLRVQHRAQRRRRRALGPRGEAWVAVDVPEITFDVVADADDLSQVHELATFGGDYRAMRIASDVDPPPSTLTVGT